MLPCRLGREWSHSETFPWSASNGSISLAQYWGASWLKEWQLRKGWGGGLERGRDVSSALDLAAGSGREGGVCSLCHSLNESHGQWCQSELIRSTTTHRSTPVFLQLNFLRGFFLLWRGVRFSKVELFGEIAYSSVFEKPLERWLICKREVELLHLPHLDYGETEAQRVNDATVGASGVWASETRGGWIGGNICSWSRIKAQELLIPNSRFLPQNCHMLHQLKKLNIGGQR